MILKMMGVYSAGENKINSQLRAKKWKKDMEKSKGKSHRSISNESKKTK